MHKDVFVVGLDGLNAELLRSVPALAHCRFHQLLDLTQLRDGVDIVALLARAHEQLDGHRRDGGRVDAIMGYWDFPVTTMVPLLAERYGVPGAPLDAVVRCEHKYWSRLEQAEAIDEHPAFALIDPDSDRLPDHMSYPVWIKPVKSYASKLAFRATDDDELRSALTDLREGIPQLGDAFDTALDYIDLPLEIAEAGGRAALVEEAVDGDQFTLEGYRHDDTVHVYGVVESIRYADQPSFLRFQYPSRLDPRILGRMARIAERVITRIGLDTTPFNVEFFLDRDRDQLTVLEVNPRHSQSHARLFDLVDGIPNHALAVWLALGEPPRMPYRDGRHAVAAKWFLRRFEDGIVRRVPSQADLDRVRANIPDVVVDVSVRPGDRLSDVQAQDAYSYQLATIVTGGVNEADLVAAYQRCLAELPFEIDPLPDHAVGAPTS